MTDLLRAFRCRTPRPWVRQVAGVASCLALCLLVARGSPAGQVPPAGERAAASFRDGMEAYGAGDYRAAAAAFERAFRIAPQGAAMYNAARAWARAGEPARAADAYDAALGATGLDVEQRRDALAQRAALEEELGRVDVTGPTGSKLSLAHAAARPLPAHIHLPAGEHELRVEFAGGCTGSRRVRVAAGVVVRVALAQPDQPCGTSPPPPPPPERQSEGAGPSPVMLTGGLVALGLAAGSSAAAIALGTAALDARDEFDAGGHTDADARGRAVTLRTWTNVSWLGAAVLAAAGAGLVFGSFSLDGGGSESAPSPRPATGRATVRLGAGQIVLAGTFD